ncbi:hypothetical protein DK427_16085 [Methylobacterium radiodurans]|uniref:Uncharacterized protein n=1 Tax=Methylobacterium radiodurans TaxID=2202828 RepID=A0A2U8VUB4_9HYPH|nr:hypothetical protein DK427_16085 [Methylobacterium radiodurans]
MTPALSLPLCGGGWHPKGDGRDEVPQSGSDGAEQGSPLHAVRVRSGSRLPLSRPGLTTGPPSPAEGGGRMRGTEPPERAPGHAACPHRSEHP